MKKLLYTLFFITVTIFMVNAQDMVITGVFDAQPGAAGTKGVELYVINDIADLSIYGLGSANNGQGTDGEEFTFPAITANAGGFIYIADDSTKFHDFFGFAPIYTAGAMNINGDDAIELFTNGLVSDVVGDINMDGSGEVWDHVDGWVYRKDGTGPDDSTFVASNWTYGGTQALSGGATNMEAPSPFPILTYSAVGPTEVDAKDDEVFIDVNEIVTIDVLFNDVVPNPITSLTVVDILPEFGTTEIDNNMIVYTPNMDACGMDVFVYEACDAVRCDSALVTVNIECPPSYTQYSIGDVTQNDANGISTLFDQDAELTGRVYGININPAGLSFVIIDENNDGITVYSDEDDLGYTVNEGDIVTVRGVIGQFNGLTEIIADEVVISTASIDAVSPTIVTALGEETESQLIVIDNLSFVDEEQWGMGNSGYNMDMTDGTNTYVVRIDNDTDLFGGDIPTGAPFSVTGLGGQFDFAEPYDEGYQILPRRASDFNNPLSVQEPTLGKEISFFPNPVSSELLITATVQIDEVQITNFIGQTVKKIAGFKNQQTVQVADLQAGMYQITFVKGNDTWTEKFIKL